MQTDVTNPAAPARTANRAGKYLSFSLGKEEFAIHVQRVREIMGVLDITEVPQTPDYVKGVINLRGRVIPVVDLRLKLGMPAQEYSQRTCIIVVQGEREGIEGGAQLLTGVVVDEVSEVLNIQTADIEDTPDFGRGAAMPHLLGMAKIKGAVKILLDIHAIIAAKSASAPPEALA